MWKTFGMDMQYNSVAQCGLIHDFYILHYYMIRTILFESMQKIPLRVTYLFDWGLLRIIVNNFFQILLPLQRFMTVTLPQEDILNSPLEPPTSSSTSTSSGKIIPSKKQHDPFPDQAAYIVGFEDLVNTWIIICWPTIGCFWVLCSHTFCCFIPYRLKYCRHYSVLRK